jgi:hypothetical protein
MRTFTGVDAIAACSGSSLARILKGSVQPRLVAYLVGLSTTTGNLHRDAKESADTIGTFLVDAFHFLALFVIGATTVWSAAAAFIGLVAQGRATLGDILLLFIYLGAANHRRVAPARRIV